MPGCTDDWLPSFLGECDTRHNKDNIVCKPMPAYSGYKSSVHPGITHIFQSAAMRFGHTLVPPGVWRRSKVDPETKECKFFSTTLATSGGRHKLVDKPALRTCNSYWNSVEAIEERNIHPLLMGMASQLCEREDNIITPDLRGSVFGFLDFIRRDLMAINIQRGRDHGLPDYNTARQSFGMKKIENFKDMNPLVFENDENIELLGNLTNVHSGDISRVDVWTGGLMETQPEGPGELFREIIRDQFERIRDADRFWYENRDNGHFTEAEIAEINSITIRDVVLSTNPTMDEEDIQLNPFHFTNNASRFEHCATPLQLNETDMEECTPPASFDYFSGSEVSYALTFTFFGLFIIGTALFMLVLGKQYDRKRHLLRRKVARLTKVEKNDMLISATEIVDVKNTRDIHMRFEGKLLKITSTSRKPLRRIDVGVFRNFLIAKSYNRGRINFFQTNQVTYQESDVSMSQLQQQAVTKAQRDEQLKKFFKSALETVLKMTKAGDENKLTAEMTRKYISIEVTKDEFAEYFNMKPDNLFVNQMFNTADIDGSGSISFREFLDIMILFTKGKAEDKSRLMFNMYDLDGSGELDLDEFHEMLRSMMEMVNQEVEADKIDDLVKTMLKDHGLENKESLTFENFNKIMSDYKTELDQASLGGKATEQKLYKKILKKKNSLKKSNEINQNKASTRLNRARKSIQYYSNKNDAKRQTTKIQVKVVERKQQKEGSFQQRITKISNYMANNRYKIFWLTLYILVLMAIFAERAYFYSVEREFAGLRRIAGYGVSMTRGAASAMMFAYCSLLVTMCRNTITLLRETFLARYIPFDSAVEFHKIVAWLALFFTVFHILGHSLNIYAISTQPIFDLTCLFRG